MTNEKAAATLHGQGTRYTHEFLVLDKIGMLAATTITAQDLQLQATALADLWPSPKRNIDIIIGQDLLWINDKTPQPDIPGQDRLKVESTPFGKVISGHYQQQTQAETTNLLSTEQDMKQEMKQEMIKKSLKKEERKALTRHRTMAMSLPPRQRRKRIRLQLFEAAPVEGVKPPRQKMRKHMHSLKQAKRMQQRFNF